MSNIMVDLETMGTGPNAAIIAIGAVKFDATGIHDRFYRVVTLASSVQAGLEMDADTVLWWLAQSEDARKAITHAEHRTDLARALQEFSRWVRHSGEKVWGNGANFDNVILANAYKKVGLPQPWKFWNDRCYRTVRAENPHVPELPRVGTHHHALADAEHQAEHLRRIWQANAQARYPGTSGS